MIILLLAGLIFHVAWRIAESTDDSTPVSYLVDAKLKAQEGLHDDEGEERYHSALESMSDDEFDEYAADALAQREERR